jgi:hypothetical protein
MDDLMEFWSENNVDASLRTGIDAPAFRFFRIVKGCSVSGDELVSIGAEALSSGFFRVQSQVSLSQTAMYQEARVVGLDVSSGAAVFGLDVQPTDHVLDLCCAPGMKMLLLTEQTETGSVTGVDISEHRLNVTRNVLRKYGAKRARLFLTSGEDFSILAPPSEEERAAAAAGSEAVAYRPTGRRVLGPAGTPDDVALEAPQKKARKKTRQFELPHLLWASDFALSFESYALYDRVKKQKKIIFLFF